MVNEPRERELKYRLRGVEDWQKLVEGNGLGHSRPARFQESDYFDTRDLSMLRVGAMLRIRRDGGLRLAFKQSRPETRSSGFFDSCEYEADVPERVLDEALRNPCFLLTTGLSPVEEVLRRFGRLHLVHLGRLFNERRPVVGRHVVEIDRMTFPDGREGFEVEIETDDPNDARAWIESHFRARAITADPWPRTKLESFLDSLGRSNGTAALR